MQQAVTNELRLIMVSDQNETRRGDRREIGVIDRRSTSTPKLVRHLCYSSYRYYYLILRPIIIYHHENMTESTQLDVNNFKELSETTDILLNLRYADDTVIFANKSGNLRNFLT